MKNKTLIWIAVITAIGLGGYLTYRYIKKKQDVELSAYKKSQKTSAILKEAGSFISGLFSKKEDASNTTVTDKKYDEYRDIEII